MEQVLLLFLKEMGVLCHTWVSKLYIIKIVHTVQKCALQGFLQLFDIY